MTNAADLLSKITKPKQNFEKLYTGFINECFSVSIEESVDLASLRKVVNLLHHHGDIIGVFIEKLVSNSKASVKTNECNLLLFETLFQENADMLLSYTDIEENPILRETYLSNGANIGAFVLTTAHNWLINTGLCVIENDFET